MSIYDDINQSIREVIETNPRLASLSVNWVASAAHTKFVTGGEDIHIRHASLEHFKAQTRKILGARFNVDGEENDAHQNDMFSGTLQERYPVPRTAGADPVYKLREHLTTNEIDWNISQLEKSADARMRHAHALKAYRAQRIKAGRKRQRRVVA